MIKLLQAFNLHEVEPEVLPLVRISVITEDIAARLIDTHRVTNYIDDNDVYSYVDSKISNDMEAGNIDDVKIKEGDTLLVCTGDGEWFRIYVMPVFDIHIEAVDKCTIVSNVRGIPSPVGQYASIISATEQIVYLTDRVKKDGSLSKALSQL